MRYAATAAEAATNNVILAKGEFGYTADNDELKVGDGVRHWLSLEAVGGTGGTSLTQEQVEDFVGAMVTGNTETGITVTYDDAAAKLNFVVTAPLQATDFFRAGTMTTGTGTDRIYNTSGVTRTLVHVGIGLVTAPTGAAFIADVNKNGTTIFTTQASRPSIAVSTFYDLSSAPDVTTWASGDYLTVDRDQVGSTIAGADLTGSIFWR
jgi:hypothetical protein